MKSATGVADRGAERGANGERAVVSFLRLLGVFTLVNGVLLAPWWVLTGGLRPPLLAIEAGLVVGTFAILPRNRRRVVAAVAVASVVVLSAVVGMGDTTLRLSLGRPLNLYLDLWLLGSVQDLMVGTLGTPAAIAALVVVPVLLLGLTALLASLLVSLRIDRGARSLRLASFALVAFVGIGLAAERLPTTAPLFDVPTARLVRDQSSRFATMMNEREWFSERLARLPESYSEYSEPLARLQGRDVIFGFIESYGVTAVDDSLYASVVGPRLDDFEARMDAAGLYVVSGRLVAPSQGGQSWFAHGSMLSGVWLDNQLRYDMMLASGHETLVDDFRRLGHRTVAVMPAITTSWPEGARFGYDQIFSAPDIPYAGPALNWVTMPDQFTWSFFERSVRRVGDGPVFAELGLISSHAPWTPILPVFEDWSSIGDGSIYARFADAGPGPNELWRDADRIREYYAKSIEYAVHTMVAYAERYVDDRTLLLLLGDHQPAPLITGEGATWDVPVHVVSGDRSLLEPFLEWGFVEGAWPNTDEDRETLGVDYFRDWFVRAYSGS